MRDHPALLAVLISFSLLAPLPARAQSTRQTPETRTQPAQQDADDDVVRITTNLVQVDAVVLDKDGRHVTDLRAEDFEILEDGREKPITHFSYVRTTPAAGDAQPAHAVEASRGKGAKREAAPVAPAVLRPEDTRRTIVIAVDDLGLSSQSVYYARQALKKFVEENVGAGDLVAVVRTGSSVGALQQLTSDKRQILAAIDSLRWNSRGRMGVSQIVPSVPSDTDSLEAGPNAQTRVGESGGGMADLGGMGGDGGVGDLRERITSIGTLNALAFYVRGLREMPGRKSIVVVSDYIPVHNSRGESIMETEMRRLIDLANRSSVTFYGIDPRGLPTLNVDATRGGIQRGGIMPGGMGIPGGPPAVTLSQVQRGQDPAVGAARTAYFRSQDGMNHLTRETGGFALFNNNDIHRGLARVLDDQSGYYLIGYRPDERTFDPATGARRFRSLKIKVKRSGLTVRSRSGFYGSPERERKPQTQTREQVLVQALSSPFTSGGVNLKLTALFGNEAAEGSFMRSMLFIDTRDLTFVPDGDDWQKAVIDVLAAAFNADGTVAGQTNRTHTLRARGDTLAHVRRNGIVYTLNVPVRQAGAYQLRFAVRDVASERIGTANEFIEVPDFKRDHLALSGVVAVGIPANAAAPGASDATENPQHSPAVRRFQRGMRMDFGYLIYNARLERATGKPRLTTEVRLFRDGQKVFASDPEPFDAGSQTDLARLTATGRLRLGGDLTPGAYVLQVVVTDEAAGGRRQATQWVDFEIVR